MSNLNFTFSSDPENRFPFQQMNGGTLETRINLEIGVLRITINEEVSRDFPLVKDNAPFQQAIFISQVEGCLPKLEIGTADFGDHPLYLENYQLNSSEFNDEWNLRLSEGHVGILDLRNLRVSTQTRFFLEMVPIQLSISGIYLRVTTIKHLPDSNLESWYIKSNI